MPSVVSNAFEGGALTRFERPKGIVGNDLVQIAGRLLTRPEGEPPESTPRSCVQLPLLPIRSGRQLCEQLLVAVPSPLMSLVHSSFDRGKGFVRVGIVLDNLVDRGFAGSKLHHLLDGFVVSTDPVLATERFGNRRYECFEEDVEGSLPTIQGASVDRGLFGRELVWIREGRASLVLFVFAGCSEVVWNLVVQMYERATSLFL